MDWRQVTLERDLNEAFRLGFCMGAALTAAGFIGWRTFWKWVNGKEK